jgi:hypothetical protein
MATPTDPATNLALAQQLLTVMADITAQMDKQGKLLQTQNQLFEALCKSQECADGSKVRDLTAAAREAQEELDRTTTTGSRLEEVVKNIGNWASKLSVPAEFLNGFKSGLNLSTNVFKNILSLGGTALGMLKNIGMSLLSLPGKLMDLFQTGGGGADPYRQQLEKLRGEFGNLQIGTSKAILGMMPHMKDFEQSGLRLSRVFGYGREGLAKQLEEFMKIATEMGPVARVFMNAAAASSGLVAALSKSGLGADAFKSLTAASLNGGETVDRAVKGMVKDVARAERTFGISARELQKDVTEISKNFATFGPVARGVMLATSAYVKKLGISIETLKKIADKSFNFEDAAEQAAKLGETFNMALDPMRLMKANPAEKLDMIREAFFKTGKNIEQMTVQERNYLAATAGMTEEEARLAFAQKNRALSNAQLQEQMKKSQKTPITQAEAMQTLAKSIERLVQSGSGMKGSFIDIFFKGFERGIRRSKEFRDVVRNLQRSLRTVYFAGVEVGRMFVKEFPGIKTMLLALKDMFDPRRFRELMGRVVGEFRRFFQALQTDPKAGVKVFMTNMKKIFFDFFNKGAPAGGRFLDGLKMFFKTVGVIFVQGLQYAFESLRDVLKFVIETIKDPSRLKAGAAEVGDGIAGMFQQAFVYVATELGPILKEIGGQLVELLTMVFERYIKPHLMHLVGAIFGPALFFGVARAAGAALLQTGFTAVFSKFFNKIPAVPGTGGLGGGGAPPNPMSMARDLGNFGVGLAKIALAMAAIALTVKLLMPLILSIAKDVENSGLSKESIAVTVVLLGLMGALFLGIGNMLKGFKDIKISMGDLGKIAILLVMVAGTLLVMIPIALLAVNTLGGFPADQVATALLALGGMVILFGGIGLLVRELVIVGKDFNPADVKNTGIALLAIVVVLLVLIGISWLAIKALGDFKVEQVATTLLALGGMAILFGGISLLVAGLIFIGTGIGLSVGGAFAAIGLGLVAVVGVLVVIALAAAAAIATLGSFPKEKVETAMLAMTAMTDMFGKVALSVGLLIGLASLLANPFALAGLALSLVAVYAAFKGIISVAKDFLTIAERTTVTKEKAEAVGIIMENVGKLLTAIVESMAKLALVGRSSVLGFILGADISGSFGTIQKMLVGADGNGGILNTMKTMIEGILTFTNNISGDPAALKAKAEVFSTIAVGISSLIKPISDVIEAVSGASGNSLLGLLFGGDPAKEVQGVIDIMLGRGGFMTLLLGQEGLIPKIIEQLKGMNVGQGESLKNGAAIFGSIASGIGEIVKVIPGMITAVTGLVDELNDEGQIGTVLTSIGGVLTGIISSISGVVTTTVASLTGLLNNPNISTEKLKAASSIGDIFKGLGEIFKAIIPPPETIKAFQQVTGSGGDWSSSINGEALSGYLTNMTNQLKSIIGNSDAEGLRSMIKGLLEISLTPSDIEKLKGIAPIMAAIGDLIGHIVPSSEILSKITSSGTEFFGNGEAASTAATNNGIRIGAFMRNIAVLLSGESGNGGLLSAVKGMITGIGTELNGLSPSSIEGLKSVAPIIAAIGSLVTGLMPSTDIMNRILVTSRSNGLDPAVLDSNKTKLIEFMGSMREFLTKILQGDGTNTGIKGFITDLLHTLSTMSLDETKIKGLQVISTILTSVAGMIGPIMSAMQGFSQGIASSDANHVSQIGEQIRGIIWALAGSLSLIFEKIPELVGLLVNMNFGRGGTRGLNAKVAAIKGIFEFVGSVMNVVTSIRGAAGGGAPITDIYGQVFSPVIQLLHYIFSGDQSISGVNGPVSLQRIITSINGLTGLKGLGAKVAVLKSLFEAIGVIATTAKTLKDTFAGAAAITAEQLTPGFTSIKAVLDAFLNGGPAAFLANMDMTNITKAHNKLVGSGGRGSSGIGAKLGAIGTAFSCMITGMTTIKTELTNFETYFPTVASGHYFDFATVERVTHDLLSEMDGLATRLAGSESGMIQRITETFTGRGFMAKVRTAVAAYNNFSRELAGLRGGDVNVSLRALNNNLVGRANQDLASTSARINVNVNVRMDAQNMSRVLYSYSHEDHSNGAGNSEGPPGSIRTGSFNNIT